MFVLGADTINPLLLNPIGIAIAILFLASIVGVLGWMLRLPKETERMHTAAKAVRSVNKLTRILVPLLKKGVLKGELLDPATISSHLLLSLPFLTFSPGFVRHLYIRG